MRGHDYLFHLAAVISIPYSYQSPRHTVDTNVIGTLNVLQAAKNAGIKKVVHTSTSEVYGSAQYVPIDEKHPLVGQSPYSASKIGADKIAEAFHLSYGLPVVTVRPFNCFGERQSLRAVIPTIITQALGGKEIKLGNLHTTRDYTYVKDTVQGFIKAMEAEDSAGKVFNISSNFEISIKDIAEKVIAQVNPKIKITLDSQRTRPENSEVQRLWGDNAKAKSELSWRPQHSFDEGLKNAIEYYKHKMHQLRPEEYHV
jgi:nucleoside-diphosphate-sugar epimerase